MRTSIFEAENPSFRTLITREVVENPESLSPSILHFCTIFYLIHAHILVIQVCLQTVPVHIESCSYKFIFSKSSCTRIGPYPLRSFDEIGDPSDPRFPTFYATNKGVLVPT